MKYVFLIFAGIVIGTAFAAGFKLTEQRECAEWAEQAKSYPGNFYYANWQKAQCGIK